MTETTFCNCIIFYILLKNFKPTKQFLDVVKVENVQNSSDPIPYISNQRNSSKTPTFLIICYIS